MINRIKKAGIVPVIKLEDEKKAVPLAKALIKGGINVIEITFRTAAAEAAIKNIVNECPEMLVGAGTVTNIENLMLAINAGAKFIVSPGSNPNIIKATLDKGLFMLPGVITPTEIEAGMDLGLNVFKFFPCSSFGGLKTINALCAPYNGVKFVPTGGINADNVAEYFQNKHVLAVGGTWIAPSKLIEEGDFHKITRLVNQAVELRDSITG